MYGYMDNRVMEREDDMNENHMVTGQRFEESYDREPDEDAAYEELRQEEIDRRYAKLVADDLLQILGKLVEHDTDGSLVRKIMGEEK